MRQVLLTIPLGWLRDGWAIPINTYGMMLFCAFVGCSAMAKRMCRRERIDPELIPDLIIWLFVAGIAGGRAVFVTQYWHEAGFDVRPLWHIFALWDGGLVLYGALFGGAIGYFAYHHFVLSKYGVSHWKMLDVIAPCLAVGVAFGRIGCLGTGCCYGNVACESCPAIHFPLWNNSTPPGMSPAATKMIRLGNQTPLGFLFKGNTLEVLAVEPGSEAEQAGLRTGDIITVMECEVDGKRLPIPAYTQEVFQKIGQFRLTVHPPRVTLETFKHDRQMHPEWAFKGKTLEVESVEPGSAPAKAGLREGDVVVAMQVDGTFRKGLLQDDFRTVNGMLQLVVDRLGDATTEIAIDVNGHAKSALVFRDGNSPVGPLLLTVRRGAETLPLAAFYPTTIGLNPTQIYESISMVLLLFFLLSYYPYKRHDGELLVIFMVGYGCHRFLNEMLRTDTDPVAFGLTLSQNVSILVLIGAAILAVAVWRRPMPTRDAIPTAV